MLWSQRHGGAETPRSSRSRTHTRSSLKSCTPAEKRGRIPIYVFLSLFSNLRDHRGRFESRKMYPVDLGTACTLEYLGKATGTKFKIQAVDLNLATLK